MHTVKRVHPVIYILITNHYATYDELKNKLTIDDMLNLYEIAMVTLYNKSEIMADRLKK